MLKLSQIHLYGGRKKLLDHEEFIAQLGQLTLICGESGCGKSTFLYEIGLLSKHQEISYLIDDIDVRQLSNKELLCLKRYEMGYVFQTSDLFDDEDVCYNICHFASLVNREIEEKQICDYLRLLDLQIDIHQKIKTLSGGERQRIAILCALVKESQILVLDEITSALDSDNEERILKILKDIAVKKNITVILVSHSALAKQYADKIYEMKDQKLVCLKDGGQTGKLTLNLKRSLHISFKQYIEYTKRYFHRYLFLNSLLIFALVCGLAFLSFIEYYQLHYTNTIIQEVESLSYNELWIHDQKTGHQQDLKMKEIIQNIGIDVAIYPYFKGQCIVDEQLIDVVPFYKNNKNSHLLSFESKNQTQVFVCDSLIKNQKETISIYQNEISVNGVFNQGVRFYGSGYKYIAMDEEAALRYADDLIYDGYIVRTKSFLELVELNDVFHSLGYQVDSSMQNIEVLNQYILNAQYLMNLYGIGATVFILLVFSIFYVLYYHSRRYEIVYLKVNGYTNRQITGFLVMENMFRFFVSTILSLLLTLIVKYNLLHMDIEMNKLLIQNIILSALFVIVPYIFSCLYIYFLKPVNVYRK